MSSGSLINDAAARAPYLARLLGRDPNRRQRVIADPYLERAKPAAVLVEELGRWLEGVGEDSDELARRLRQYRADELVRCGVRELGLEKPIEVGEELAHLADACLDAAIGHHRALLEATHGAARYRTATGEVRDAELVVIAMGKHGGEELNFASDIDILYVYTSDAQATDDPETITLHGFFTELCRRVSASLGEVTDEDVVFRVDLRLRPEGSRGAMANSLPSLERYYESWGRPWERQAWLKARPCAGSLTLGDEVMAMMKPFVYPRSSSIDVVKEVRSLNQRIKVEQRSGGIDRGFDVKNGVGGIREVEFFVQTLQLLWSPTMPQLRTRSTMGALEQLLFAGLISESERRALGLAYRFMRHVEHMLQLDSGRQTQTLPGDAQRLAEFSARLGFETVEEFDRTLADHTRAVAALFASLDEDSDETEQALLAEIGALLAGTLPEERESEVFTRLGFLEPTRAVTELERARRLASSPLGIAPRGAAAAIAPMLLLEVSKSPDPDQAFGYLSDLAARRSSFSSIWRLMADHPPLLRLIASVFGTSHFLSKQLVSHPDLLGVFVDAGSTQATVSALDLVAAFDTRERLVDSGDDEAMWNAIAAAKSAQHLRIGLADVAGELAEIEVCEELSKVADECLARALSLATRSMQRYGWPRTETGHKIGFAVMALGKLGGRELGYASDLDVVFVFEEDGESEGERTLDATTFFSRLAQRLMRGLHAQHRSGRLYEVDTRLRPSGSQGLLVSSLAAWRNYHRDTARLWERQALVKLRAVAGDPSLGELLETESMAFAFREGQDPVALANSIAEMRSRMERELASRGANLKVGRGGLVDIEFAAQYLQLLHGHAHPSLRTQGTLAAIEAAIEVEVCDPLAGAVLADGYRYLRFLEHRMRIVHDRSVATLPEGGLELDKLARRTGYARAEALTEGFEKWTAMIRDAFRQIVAVG